MGVLSWRGLVAPKSSAPHSGKTMCQTPKRFRGSDGKGQKSMESVLVCTNWEKIFGETENQSVWLLGTCHLKWHAYLLVVSVKNANTERPI